jgi:hypothetical protein
MKKLAIKILTSIILEVLKENKNEVKSILSPSPKVVEKDFQDALQRVVLKCQHPQID